MGLALVMGYVAVRLKLPALVGYLIAGILVGPYSPGFIADAEIASQLAEIGVMLLMFGIGLHFSPEDLISVRRIAIPGALAQIVLATGMGLALAYFWDWPFGTGLIFGLSLSVASTVVLMRGLESQGILESIDGRIAIGWLVVEDLAMVMALVLLPPFAAHLSGAHSVADLFSRELLVILAWSIGKVGLFILLMLFVGARLFPWLLWQVERTGSRELFTLCVIAVALGIAYGAGMLFDVSFALGAFFAGMILRKSHLSYRAADESLPLRDAFSVLFFVSVGMLFNPMILIEQPMQVLAVVATIVFGKSAVAFLIVLGFRYSLHTALTVSASLAQIGEFSFILLGVGKTLSLIPDSVSNLVLAGAIFSIALNPLLFHAISPFHKWVRTHTKPPRVVENAPDPLKALPLPAATGQWIDHAVLVGYGHVGRQVAQQLGDRGHSVVIAELNREIVERLRVEGAHALFGDAIEPTVLSEARIQSALLLIIATPDTFRVRKMVEAARILNPEIEILIRSHSEEDAAILEAEKAGKIFLDKHELALNMTRYALTLADARLVTKNAEIKKEDANGRVSLGY
jgi:monovalent cation:H+ antiporter-2, CPA2 family